MKLLQKLLDPRAESEITLPRRQRIRSTKSQGLAYAVALPAQPEHTTTRSAPGDAGRVLA
jgi:hypothetical protein